MEKADGLGLALGWGFSTPGFLPFQEVANGEKNRTLPAMPMTLDQIVDETRQLPQDLRAELVERILLSVHGGIAPHVESAWQQETRRRVADIQTGRAKGIPLDDALAAARKRVGL